MSNSSKKHGFTITVENASHEIFWFKNENGNVFFNITAIWKAAGSPDNRRPQDYKRTEDGQRHIVQQYRTLINNVSPGHLSFDPDTWVYKKGTSLPDEVLSLVEKVTKGRNGGTSMIELVAMDYAQWVSVQVKDEILRTYSAFGGVTRAIQDGRTDDAVIALDEAAKAVVAAELESEGEVATEGRVKARQSGIKQRRAFTDLVEAMLGKDASPDEVGRVIGMLTNMTYQACFGVQAQDMREGLCCTNPRDAFSANAIRAMEYAEGVLCKGFSAGRYKTMDDYKDHLMQLSPLLRMMANEMGDDPVVMENTNGPRVKVRPQGTFLGIMPAGASKVGFTAKELTSEQN